MPGTEDAKSVHSGRLYWHAGPDRGCDHPAADAQCPKVSPERHLKRATDKT